MASVGQLLRQEREMQSRTIREIADATCICGRYLEALETDNHSEIPGHFFVKSFVRQYALALGIDPAPLERELGTPAEVDPIPALCATYSPVKLSPRKSSMAAKTVAAGAFLVMALSGSGFLYSQWQRAEVMEEPAAQAEEVAPREAKPQAAPEPAPAPAIPAPAIPAPSPTTSSRIQVSLAAVENTWISVFSEGRTIFRGTLAASEQKAVEVEPNARLLTGNAAGVDVRLNGRSIGPIGQRGQVRVVKFTGDSYEILPYRGS